MAGIIALLGSLCLLGFAIYFAWVDWWVDQSMPTAELLFLVVTTVTAIFTIYYIISSLLGGSTWSEVRELELQNRILKTKIEREKLKKQLAENIDVSESRQQKG